MLSTQKRLPPQGQTASRFRSGVMPTLILLVSGVAMMWSAATQASALIDTRPDEMRVPGPLHATDPSLGYRASHAADQLQISTHFRDFDGQALQLDFALPSQASRQAQAEFGISRAELAALKAECKADAACDQAAYDRRWMHYYQAHGVRMRSQPGEATHLFVDVPQVVERNRARVQPVVDALRRLAFARGESPEWAVDAAIALVQNGLDYRKPAMLENQRQTLGFYTPPRALEAGFGDCDTKAALLAAILQGLTRHAIIGVHLPHHYLLGIAREPRDGEAHLRYAGRTYVLIETSGPARMPPGRIARTTELALASGDGVRVDPMFQ